MRVGLGDAGTALGLRLGPGQSVPEEKMLAQTYLETKEHDILGKCSGKRLLGADLLAADEGLHGHGNGAVNVLGRAVLGQAHLAERFSNTHDGF